MFSVFVRPLTKSQVCSHIYSHSISSNFWWFYLGNGYIPTSCLKEILRELDDQLTDDELEGMIDEIDADGSGTVDFDGKKNIYLI